jgi:predicted phage baseplate assembly protein
MSLPVRDLDDRRFQDLVDEAKRLIPTYCPEWTNHNVSDPGVALIELFAWMTEMAIFRLNQVPDTFYTRMLNLLGFEQFPAKAARADVTFWLTASTAPTVGVPAGTEVATDGSLGESRVFTLLDDLEIRQPQITAALTSTGNDIYTDVWEDLRLTLTPVTCFPSAPLTPGDCFYLGFSTSLANNVLRLTITADVEGIGVMPDRPPLAWEVWSGEGWVRAAVPERLADGSSGDTTGGLNRNGSLVLLVPRVHEPLTLGGTRAHWVRARLLPTEPGQPPYRSSPKLLEVKAQSIGGTGTAEHSQVVVDEHIGVSNGKPNQVFRLDLRPVLARTGYETVNVTAPDGSAEDWEEVADFVKSGPDDKHYVLDSTTGEIHFGPRIRYPDGSRRQHGASPAEGSHITMTRYRSGGGAAGNVGAGTLVALRQAIPYIAGVSNLRSATGGVDAEDVENAKLRGPLSIRTGSRAVTATDFERLASEADSAVGRVRCLPPVAPGDPVRVLVVPKLEEPPEQLRLDDFALPDSMLQRVSRYLDERRILGSTIEIGTPYYQGVTIAALVAARAGRPTTLIRDRVTSLLYRYLNPITGGPDGNGWKFDEDLNAATVFQLIETVEGVERVDDVLFFEYDLRNHERLGFGKELVKLGPDSLFLSSNHQVVVR